MQLISSDRSIEEIYGTFTKEIGKLISFDRTSICVLDQAGSFYRVIAVSEKMEPMPCEGVRVPLRGSVFEWLELH